MIAAIGLNRWWGCGLRGSVPITERFIRANCTALVDLHCNCADWRGTALCRLGFVRVSPHFRRRPEVNWKRKWLVGGAERKVFVDLAASGVLRKLLWVGEFCSTVSQYRLLAVILFAHKSIHFFTHNTRRWAENVAFASVIHTLRLYYKIRQIHWCIHCSWITSRLFSFSSPLRQSSIHPVLHLGFRTHLFRTNFLQLWPCSVSGEPEVLEVLWHRLNRHIWVTTIRRRRDCSARLACNRIHVNQCRSAVANIGVQRTVSNKRN